ncbi:hypothetical protein [Paludibacterium sp.]|uniref:hypothetical protein n=1 Tax=Paludibacterium sp. TaxID=1917523 RepID=UPI0025F59FC5|nr:hypothetical protein [Paludibacterium sp.]MBV8646710.1 hypothetical protein [Paludibacterium sp.]
MAGWKGALAAIAALAAMGSAQAKSGITWMTADLPPATIFEGDMAGGGFAEQQLKVLIAALPDYDHQIVKGAIARNWHELETRDGVCFNWVTHNTASHWNAVFSKHPVLNPGYRLAVRTTRLTEFLPFAATGDVDLSLLAKDDTFSGGYIASRDYLPAINGFIASDGRKAKLQKTVDSPQLLELLHANRIDFIFASPSEIKFYRESLHLKDDFAVLKVKGTPAYNEGYIACSSGVLGKEVMAKIDAYLERPEGWAAYVAPLQRWLDPSDYAFAASSRGR